MPKNDLGELRRSAAVATFGPGAIVDFRAGGATISALAGGLEEWDTSFPPAGMLNEQAVREERLQKKLGVKGFRLPPVRDPLRKTDVERALPAVRFPQWLQCPVCDRVGKEELWADDFGQAGRYCGTCTNAAPGRRKIYVVPVRFVLACEAGHLDEFPWHWWAGHKEGCANRKFLVLKAEQAGLAGLILRCPSCGSARSMDGVFSKETWEKFSRCAGRRPWLATGPEHCDHHPRAVQRGASNLYFPVIESALSIPPWSDRLQEALGVYWDPIVNAFPEDRIKHIEFLATTALSGVLSELNMTPAQLAAEVERRVDQEHKIQVSDLRLEEYRQFTGGTYVQGLDREFEIRPQGVPDVLKPWISRLVKVCRLREVRAMTGFTRIHPPGDGATNVAKLSVADNLGWLPAIEVRGEGIFLELNLTHLKKWEDSAEVQARAARIDTQWMIEWREKHGAASSPQRSITPRHLLIHTFAHALIRQLTLECGYSSSALRERLYVSGDMAGLLIYTATTDDDGTLGGLQRQGDPARIGRTIISAVQAQMWCSSDPLCIEDMLMPHDGLSLAACHSCVLAPETSCEEFNRFLDRAMLVGTPSTPALAYFQGLADSEAT